MAPPAGGVAAAEAALSQSTIAAAEARLRALPRPRLLPPEIIGYLKKSHGGGHALERLQAGHSLLSDLETELEQLDARIYKFSELRQSYAVDLTAAVQFRSERRQGEAFNPLKPDKDNVTAVASDGNVQRAQAGLEECDGQLRRLNQKRAELGSRVSALQQRETTCLRRLRLAMGGSALVFVPLPDTNRTTLPDARAKIVRLKQEGESIKSAPLSVAEVKAKIDAGLARQCSKINIANLFDPDDEMGFRVPTMGPNGLPDRGGVLWRYLLEQLRTDLHAQADAIAAENGKAAMTAEQRATKQRKLKLDLAYAERIEEQVVWSLLRLSEPVTLRADSNPLAILCAEDAARQ
jgi:hypothetical protein